MYKRQKKIYHKEINEINLKKNLELAKKLLEMGDKCEQCK